MKTEIDTLKRDIQIHKEVEKELAKRSHFCQKVIKRLKVQIKELEDEKAANDMRKPAVMGISGGHNRRNKSFMGMDSKHNQANEDLINFLEHKLEEIEKKLHRTQGEYEHLQSEYMDL